nr:PREDICTED: transcription factor HES-1-like [Apteryx mantelli mantelli]
MPGISAPCLDPWCWGTQDPVPEGLPSASGSSAPGSTGGAVLSAWIPSPERLQDAMLVGCTTPSPVEPAALTAMHLSRPAAALSTDPTVLGKYRAGFSECMNEVTRFLSTCEGVNTEVRTRLLGHLASCMTQINAMNYPAPPPPPPLPPAAAPSPDGRPRQAGHGQSSSVPGPVPRAACVRAEIALPRHVPVLAGDLAHGAVFRNSELSLLNVPVFVKAH